MIFPHQAIFAAGVRPRLNIRSPKISWGLLCTAVLIVRDPATPTLPLHLGSYTRALLVS
jgi:hypothetical protein